MAASDRFRRLGYVFREDTPDDRAFQRWAQAQYEKAAEFCRLALNTKGFLSVSEKEESLIEMWLQLFEKVASPLVYLRDLWDRLPMDERKHWMSPEDKAYVETETKKALKAAEEKGAAFTKPEAEPDVTTLFGPNLGPKLTYDVQADEVILRPREYFGTETFRSIIHIVRDYGGTYVSAGKDSHFRIPRPIRQV